MAETNDNVVIDRAQSQISDLWKKEDYWAIWLGFVIILFGYFYFVSGFEASFTERLSKITMTLEAENTKPFKTVAYYEATDLKSALKVSNEPGPKAFLAYLKTPTKWTSNPIDSLYLSQAAADEINGDKKTQVADLKTASATALEAAKAADKLAADSGYADTTINAQAVKAIDDWRAAKKAYDDANGKLKKPYNYITTLSVLGLVFAVMFSVGGFFMGYNLPKFFIGFIGVYLLTIFANILGQQATTSYYGINAEVSAIVLGMLIANTIGTPKWLKPGVQVEYYIKTGLVCLGAEVLFSKILAIGIPGIFVAWIVTPVVLITTYIFGQKVLKMESKTLNIVISADMSVCGTSAAIATASACRAKKEELTLAIGLSLTFTAIMMIAIPAFAKAVGMPEVLAGAWIGGTVDSTGAVAAAGALIGPKAMQVAATIKMIQNVLIGLTAFGVALYWCAKVDRIPGESVSPMEIWHRFPKFVLGFLAASILCSYWSSALGAMSGPLFDSGLVSLTKSMRSWCFALAFLSIGLATNFRELAHYFKGGKPVILYVCGQTLNLCLTLGMAYVMFYLVFPEITASI